jgi:hypothetical protein
MAGPPVGFFESHFLYKPNAGTRVCSFGLGLDWTGPGPIPDPTEMAEICRLAAVHVDSIGHSSWVGADWSFLGVDCTYQTEEGPLTGSSLATVAGAGTAAQIPVNGSILVKKNTASGGRRNRGRLFMPPVYPAEGLVDSIGIIAAPAVTNLTGRFSSFYNQLIIGLTQPVLFHSEAPFTPTPIISFTVENLLATQRRRMRR